MAKSTTARAITFILREIVGEVIYFPVWWYSHGLGLTARALTNKWFSTLNRLSIPIFFRTIGKPMYGDYTRSGRVISFFFRLFLLGVNLFVLSMWTIIEMVVLLLWIAGPAIAAGMLVRQLIPLTP